MNLTNITNALKKLEEFDLNCISLNAELDKANSFILSKTNEVKSINAKIGGESEIVIEEAESSVSQEDDESDIHIEPAPGSIFPPEESDEPELGCEITAPLRSVEDWIILIDTKAAKIEEDDPAQAEVMREASREVSDTLYDNSGKLIKNRWGILGADYLETESAKEIWISACKSAITFQAEEDDKAMSEENREELDALVEECFDSDFDPDLDELLEGIE